MSTASGIRLVPFGLKLPALRGEARLRGRERNNFSKIIISVATLPEAGTRCDAVDMNNGQRNLRNADAVKEAGCPCFVEGM